MTNRVIGCAAAVAAVLYAYAVVGEAGALLAAAAVFVLSTGLICLHARPVQVRGNRFRIPRLRKRQPSVSQLHRLDFEIARAIESGRRYDHSLRPRLFDLTATLLVQRRAIRVAGPVAVREFLGSELWPFVDPSVRSFAERPTITPTELDALMAKIEELL